MADLPAWPVTAPGAGYTAVLSPTSADPGADLTTALNSAIVTAPRVLIPAGTYNPKTIPTAPAGVHCEIVFAGTDLVTWNLSAAVPRFLDPAVSGATYTVCGRGGFTINDNNTGGNHHKVFGSVQNGTQMANVFFQGCEWTGGKVRIINVPNTSFAGAFRFQSGQVAGGGPAGINQDNVIEDWEMNGGRMGVYIGSNGAANATIITRRNRVGRGYHDVGVIPTAGITGFTVQMVGAGSSGPGNYVYDIESHNVTDTPFEMDGEAVCERLTGYDCWNGHFLTKAFVNWADPDGMVAWSDCRGIYNNTVPHVGGCGIQNGNAAVLGHAHFHKVFIEVNGQVVTNISLWTAESVPIKSVTYLDCGAINGGGWNYNSASSLFQTYCNWNFTGVGGIPTRLKIDGFSFSISGQQGGAGFIDLKYILLLGTINLDIKRVTFDVTVTGQTAGHSTLFTIGTTGTNTIYGKIDGVDVLSWAGDTTPTVCNVAGTTNLTITPGILELYNFHIGAMPGGTNLITGATNNSTFTYGHHWATPTYPQAGAALTPGASPYTYTNQDRFAEMIGIIGGTVSNITYNGTQMATTTNEAFPLEPGDTVTVTYSVAPAMNKKPMR